MKPLKYLFTFVPAAAVWVSLTQTGWLTWFGTLFVFGFIPLLEWVMGVKQAKINEDELQLRAKDPIYDWMLYIVVPFQWATLAFFAHSMYLNFNASPENQLSLSEIIGRIFAMGILCGSFGINVAHELGHRSNKTEQFLAKTLLLSSLYMHFFIEHNRGHHKSVATPEDPSSARLNEPVQLFWIRSMVQTWLSAWHLEFERLQRNGKSRFHFTNEMLQFQIIQSAFVALIYFFGGFWVALTVLAAALVGAILLETINYIEHYGLQRRKLDNGYYERVELHHSWNSDHLIGRLILFELSRHSDHHYKTNKKYQTLISADEAPQMPTGYPGMMVLSLITPLWFYVMNDRVGGGR